MSMLRLGLFAVMAAGLVASGSAVADDRVAVPSNSSLEKAEGTIKELFKDAYAKTRPADRVALAEKLLKVAKGTKDDLASVYVLFREARDLAAKGGAGLLSMRAADELTARFALRSGEAHAAAADVLVSSSNTVGQALQTGDALLGAAIDARADQEWDHTLTLLKGAAAIGRRSKNGSLVNAVRDQLKEVDALKAEDERVNAHRLILKSRPDDPGANLAVGRLCMLKQDWPAAMEHLRKCGVGALKDAAEADAKAAAGSAVEWVAAADAWYDLAPAPEHLTKEDAKLRAYVLYVKSVAELKGLDKIRIEKRVAELQSDAEARIDRTKVWAAIRRAIREEQLTRGRLIGGFFAEKTFEEIPQLGGILVGFHYTTQSKGRFPGAIQPIFLTPRGEIIGTGYGTPEKGAKPKVAKAKPGYAVGALYIRSGGGFDAFKPIFMRVTQNGLDPNDKYDGPQIGGQTGNEGTLGGDGKFIIGLHGKVNDKGKIEAMSPVTVTATTPKP